LMSNSLNSDIKSDKKEERSSSSDNLNFLQMLEGTNKRALSDEELIEIENRIQKYDLNSKHAEIISRDPNKSSEEIPYYRNFKEMIFSLLTNIPAELLSLQDINAYLINEIPKSKITWIPNERKSLSMSKYSKIGNVEGIKDIFGDFIFFLRLKKDVDYEESRITPSEATKWILRFIFNYESPHEVVEEDKQPSLTKAKDIKKHMQTLHVVFKPEDHTSLQKLTGLSSETKAYRLIMQLINLLVFHYRVMISGHVHQRLKDILEGKNQPVQLIRTVKDLKVEPFHLWTSVTSLEERAVIKKRLGKDIVKDQSKLLDEYRRGKDNTAAKKLTDLQTEVKRTLPQGFFSVLYGRLKIYNQMRKSHPERFPVRPNTKDLRMQMSYGEFLSYVNKDKLNIDLFAEENVTAICSGLINRSTEIVDLTTHVRFDETTKKMLYLRKDLSKSLTYRSWKENSSLNKICEWIASRIDEKSIEL